MKFVKKYKGIKIYKLDNGNYTYSFTTTNIATIYEKFGKEFPSIRQCKKAIDLINNLY